MWIPVCRLWDFNLSYKVENKKTPRKEGFFIKNLLIY